MARTLLRTPALDRPVPWASLLALTLALGVAFAPNSVLAQALRLPLAFALFSAGLVADWARFAPLSIVALVTRGLFVGALLGPLLAMSLDPALLARRASVFMSALVLLGLLSVAGGVLRAALALSGRLGLQPLALTVTRRSEGRVELSGARGERYVVERPREHVTLASTYLEPDDRVFALVRVEARDDGGAPYREAAPRHLRALPVVAADGATFRRRVLGWSLIEARWVFGGALGSAFALLVASSL